MTFKGSKVKVFFGGKEITGFTEITYHPDRVERRDEWVSPKPIELVWVVGRCFEPSAPRHYSGRGEGLIPDSAFGKRYGRNRPTTERTHAPEAAERDRTRLKDGCYHRKPVRYDQRGDPSEGNQ